MLHGIESIFPPAFVTNHPGGDSLVLKKLLKQEGIWEYEKEILGLMINRKNFTIQLPEDKCQKILAAIKKVLESDVCGLHRFQELAGKL
eukprot:11526299-Ditylum_brightwellii.AAC.1